MKKATDEEILAFIARFWKERGYPPTVRQVGLGVGLRSTSTVHARLASLQRRGKLISEPHQPRTLRLVPDA